MIRTLLTRTVRGDIMLAAVFSCLFALSALAQNSGAPSQVGPNTVPTGPAKAIGPAPAHSPQKQALDSALSAQTRQTLQDAMNSVHTPDTYHPAPPAK